MRTLLCFISAVVLPHSTFPGDISYNGDDYFEVSVVSEEMKRHECIRLITCSWDRGRTCLHIFYLVSLTMKVYTLA